MEHTTVSMSLVFLLCPAVAVGLMEVSPVLASMASGGVRQSLVVPMHGAGSCKAGAGL